MRLGRTLAQGNTSRSTRSQAIMHEVEDFFAALTDKSIRSVSRPGVSKINHATFAEVHELEMPGGDSCCHFMLLRKHLEHPSGGFER